MQKTFLDHYFPAHRTTTVRKEICGAKQGEDESLYEYWERFKKLCSSCPNHQIKDELLVQYFYEGLVAHDRAMLDAASGGALVDKVPEEARQLIITMAENSQQFSSRPRLAKRVGEASSNPGLETKLEELTNFMKQMLKSQSPRKDVCAVQEGSFGYDDQLEDANYMGRREYNPHSNSFNEGWKDHPNLRYGNPQEQGPQQGRGFTNERSNQGYGGPSSNNQGGSRSLDDIVRSLAISTLSHQKRTDASIGNLEAQMGQLSSSMKRMEEAIKRKDFGGPPAKNVSQLESLLLEMEEEARTKEEEEIKEEAKEEKQPDITPNEVKEDEKVCAVFQGHLPQKCGDPGNFSIPITINGKLINDCMLDLGASINVMSKNVFDQLKIGGLSKSSIVVTLADRSKRVPLGFLENVIILVKDLPFLCDFYVMEMGTNSLQGPPILLGRPFLMTTKCKIDVGKGTLSLGIDDHEEHFNVFEDKKLMNEDNVSMICPITNPSHARKVKPKDLQGRRSKEKPGFVNSPGKNEAAGAIAKEPTKDKYHLPPNGKVREGKFRPP